MKTYTTHIVVLCVLVAVAALCLAIVNNQSISNLKKENKLLSAGSSEIQARLLGVQDNVDSIDNHPFFWGRATAIGKTISLEDGEPVHWNRSHGGSVITRGGVKITGSDSTVKLPPGRYSVNISSNVPDNARKGTMHMRSCIVGKDGTTMPGYPELEIRVGGDHMMLPMYHGSGVVEITDEHEGIAFKMVSGSHPPTVLLGYYTTMKIETLELY